MKKNSSRNEKKADEMLKKIPSKNTINPKIR